MALSIRGLGAAFQSVQFCGQIFAFGHRQTCGIPAARTVQLDQTYQKGFWIVYPDPCRHGPDKGTIVADQLTGCAMLDQLAFLSLIHI